MANNLVLALAVVMAFVYAATNLGEHPLYRPGVRPAVSAGLIGLIVLFLWPIWGR